MAETPLIVLASCPVPDRREGALRLSGRLKITVSPDSLAFRIYGVPEVAEQFNCSYELNPAYRDRIETQLRSSGAGLRPHPFQGQEVLICGLPGR